MEYRHLGIYPDPYWVSRLQSAGPDNYNGDGSNNNYCEFFGYGHMSHFVS